MSFHDSTIASLLGRDRTGEAPPLVPIFYDAKTQSPKMSVTGVYKAEGGNPNVDYCAVGQFQDGLEFCIPERNLRAALPEAAMGGVVAVAGHNNKANIEQGEVYYKLDLHRIQAILAFLSKKVPFDRPFDKVHFLDSYGQLEL